MGDCSKKRIMGSFLLVFVIATIALVAILVWRETTLTSEIPMCYSRRPKSDSSTDFKSNALQNRYPGYFRTLQQQDEFEQRYFARLQNRTKVPATLDREESCGYTCVPATPARKKRAATSNLIFHGCCESWTTFEVITHSTNIYGVTRKIVQFPGRKQYFHIHHCRAFSTCSGCVCSIDKNVVTAVVLKADVNPADADDLDDTEVDSFYFDGCCRCENS